MDANLRLLNTVRNILVAFPFFSAFALSRAKITRPPSISPILFYVIVAVALGALGIALVLRRRMVGSAEEDLRANSENAAAGIRWRMGNIIFLAISLAIADFGLVVWVMGATATQAAPFYAVAIACMLLLGPRRP
jgi:hypothetical protein